MLAEFVRVHTVSSNYRLWRIRFECHSEISHKGNPPKNLQLFIYFPNVLVGDSSYEKARRILGMTNENVEKT